MSAKKKPPEAVSGSYTPIPHAVLDSVAFLGASNRAKAMLFELLRQHSGRNNGRLQLAEGWLKGRAWKSSDQVQKAKAELMERGLILKTRQGGRSIGPDWFALTWLPISDCAGLDIQRGSYYPGQWRMLDPPPTVKGTATRPAARADEKCKADTATRCSPTPPHGVDASPATPPYGAEMGGFGDFPTPPHGENECCQLPAGEFGCGAAGRASGRGAGSASRPAQAPGGAVEIVGARAGSV